MPMKRLRIKVFGVVQGVGFRWFTKRLADRLGVVGWVRNLPDGSVEIEAQGKPDQLEEFLAAVKQGPPAGYVSRMEVEELTPVNDYWGFEIRL